MKIKQGLRGIAHEQGYKTAHEHGAALIWMSAGNSHFKEKVIEELLSFCSEQFSTIFVMAPENPAEHTYKGQGYSEAKARRKAQLNANLLMNRAKRVQKKLRKHNIILKDWSDHIEKNETYKVALTALQALYKKSTSFRDDVRSTTKPVIEHNLKPNMSLELGVTEAKNYLLKELAFVLVANQIFKVPQLAYVYHRDWPIYRKFIAGEYDSKPKDHLGFLIVNSNE